MGLDLYVGTLGRYHSGGWECEAVQWSRKDGLPTHVTYEKPPFRIPAETAAASALEWQEKLRDEFIHLLPSGLSWREDEAAPYISRKIDNDGRDALILAAAYAEQTAFARPKKLPASNDADPAYKAASEDYFASMICALECHMFLPSRDNFICAAEDLAGARRFITSTANLRWALETVNSAWWHADRSAVQAWARRGGLARQIARVEDGKIISIEDVPPPENPFEHCAQFGFAIYCEAVEFSEAHRLPILTDG